jgi:hypothetical protein
MAKMIRATRFQNTRIAALISLVRYSTFAKEALLCMRTTMVEAKRNVRKMRYLAVLAYAKTRPHVSPCGKMEQQDADCHKTFSEARWTRGERAMTTGKALRSSVKEGLRSASTSDIGNRGRNYRRIGTRSLSL